MSFLMILCLPIELLFKSPDASQVLLLFQKNTIPLQVGIFDPLLALVRELLDCLLLLFIESYPLLLILQQAHQVVVLFRTRFKF